jgi:hypothetical protein
MPSGFPPSSGSWTNLPPPSHLPFLVFSLGTRHFHFQLLQSSKGATCMRLKIELSYFPPSPLMSSCITFPALLGTAPTVFLGIVGLYLLLLACGGP